MSSSRASERETPQQLERLIFFSDAVFAIAITLLVIEVRVPDLPHASDAVLGQALLDLVPKYIGFLSSFFVIGRFWMSHHQLFGMLKEADSGLIWHNMFLLMAIAFMPFPTAVLSEYVWLRVGVGFYTFWFTLVGVIGFLLTRSAVRRRHLVRDDVSNEQCRDRVRGSLVPIAIGVIAFIAGMIEPIMSLVALAVASPIVAMAVKRMGRRRRS